MGKFLKKNWFVVVLTLCFTVIISYYIYDTNKDKLKGKTSNGEDVVYEVDGEDVTASEFYDDLYQSNSTSGLVTLFKKAVADASVSTTSSIKETASSQAASIRSSYQSSYGSSYESYLQSDLLSTGYTDLEEYLIEQQKINQVTADYAKEHFDELSIRQVSYILIKFDDTSNPTDEPTESEQEKMDAVDAMLKDGSSFADAAIEYSEDSSTASTGGDLGVIDKNSSALDTNFLEASLALNEGEVSSWVRSDSFGYFKIMVTAATPETLEKNNSGSDPYVALVQNYDTTLENTAIWAKAEELGIDFNGNEEAETVIKKYFNVTDTAADETSEDEAAE